MRKLIIIALLTSSWTTTSHAVEACGPELELYTETQTDNVGDSRESKDIEFGFKLTFEFGKKKACELNNALENEQTARKADLEEAKAREKNAKAEQEMIEAFEDKIKLCSAFDASAPQSILDFCGDLIKQ